MNFRKGKFKLLFILFFFVSLQGFTQNSNDEPDEVILEKGLEILKKYFIENNNWFVVKPSLEKNVSGLVNFIEDKPVDTIIYNLKKTLGDELYVFRLPENVEDSLNVEGYFSNEKVLEGIERIYSGLQKEYENKKVMVPPSVISNLEEKLPLIAEGKGNQLFIDSVYVMPQKLRIPEFIPDSLLNSPDEFQKLVETDSLRTLFIEQKRIQFNDSIVTAYIDSIKNEIKKRQFNDDLEYNIKRFNDSVKVNNYNVLRTYNEQVVSAVNDTLFSVLKTLVDFADYIDSTQVSIVNLTGTSTNIDLKNGNERFARVWLKNVQNDSLSVLVKSIDKRTVQMMIDDGVTISRYKTKETKDFDFNSLEKKIAGLNKVGKSYEMQTPWIIGGTGNIGFSQTYLENWKKGGKSALSSLIVLKGFANYSRADGKIKWDNSAEFRNGLIRPGGEGAELQKNDDKFELTSRFGVSAFKKWFYSGEFNYETQFFKGYNYPTSEHPEPISGFMAPARTFFKVGMEYKPNKNFSLLLSPLTLKNVYVRDTTVFDQTKFGIDADKNSFWEPGLNADLFFRKSFNQDISYETKYKMFFNYQAPFQKLDINWENTLVVKLNNYVNMRLLVHLIYDDDVLFPIYDENETKIGEKAKLQVKEFFSIGFAYSINRRVIKSKRIR